MATAAVGSGGVWIQKKNNKKNKQKKKLSDEGKSRLKAREWDNKERQEMCHNNCVFSLQQAAGFQLDLQWENKKC